MSNTSRIVIGPGTRGKDDADIAKIEERLTRLASKTTPAFEVRRHDRKENFVLFSLNRFSASIDTLNKLQDEFPGSVFDAETKTLSIDIVNAKTYSPGGLNPHVVVILTRLLTISVIAFAISVV